MLSVTAAVAAGAGMVRYVGPPTPTALVRSRRARGRARRRAGPGVAGRAGPRPRRRHRRTAARSATPRWTPWPRASRASWTPAALELLERGPRPAPTLLTPHAGELARLLTRLGPSRSSAPRSPPPRSRHARRLAELTGATVLLKGATTLVVEPGRGGLVRSQADAPPWLATAGSGDVLAGLAGTLLAVGAVAAGRRQRWRRWCTASPATPPTPAARCARWRWRTPYRRSWRGCWPAGGTGPERLGADELTSLPDPTPTPARARGPAGLPSRAVVDLGAIRDNVAALRRRTRGRPG